MISQDMHLEQDLLHWPLQRCWVCCCFCQQVSRPQKLVALQIKRELNVADACWQCIGQRHLIWCSPSH